MMDISSFSFFCSRCGLDKTGWIVWSFPVLLCTGRTSFNVRVELSRCFETLEFIRFLIYNNLMFICGLLAETIFINVAVYKKFDSGRYL